MTIMAIVLTTINSIPPELLDSVVPEPVLGSPGLLTGAKGVFAREAGQVAEDIVSVVVETVPPKLKVCPIQITFPPILIPEASISVPTKVELAPRVEAAVGVHHTSQADAPFESTTTDPADEFKAPFILNIIVPAPFSVIVPPPPIFPAPAIQYTPGV
jgi:hypothetical protein